MYYILENNIRVKKWMSGVACCSMEGKAKQVRLQPEEYALIKRCDGKTALPESDTLYVLEALGVIRRCQKGEAALAPGQIREYPNKLSCVIDWTITERCNYNCLHCFHAADNNIQREEFSREEAFRLLEEAEACGVSAIRLTGGEPTLYPYFREIVEEIRNRGMRLKTLITNGSRMDDELAAFIKRVHPKAQIMLSFDGIGTHDWLRQHEGSEESVRRAIKRSTGDVTFENCDAGELAVKTSTGDVTGLLRSGKVFLVETSTGSVDVPADEFRAGACRITTSTGDIKIRVGNKGWTD